MLDRRHVKDVTRAVLVYLADMHVPEGETLAKEVEEMVGVIVEQTLLLSPMIREMDAELRRSLH